MARMDPVIKVRPQDGVHPIDDGILVARLERVRGEHAVSWLAAPPGTDAYTLGVGVGICRGIELAMEVIKMQREEEQVDTDE